MSEDAETTPVEEANVEAMIVPKGRLFGVDYGHVRIGFAISDTEQRIASPLENYSRKGKVRDQAFLQRLVQEQQGTAWVVGLPISLNGTEGSKAAECREFGAWLLAILPLPVFFWDERFTSAAAEDFLLEAGLTNKKRKERLDKLAAMLMLQSFLDAGCPTDRHT